MNMCWLVEVLVVDDVVKVDVVCIVDIWCECLDVFDGLFLFGGFLIVDVMYVLVVSWFVIYILSDDLVVKFYGDVMC